VGIIKDHYAITESCAFQIVKQDDAWTTRHRRTNLGYRRCIRSRKVPRIRIALSFGRTLTHFHSFYDEGRALPPLAKHNTAPQLWISRADAEARELSSGDGIKIFNERGVFGAKVHITDDVPPGVVWIREGWVGLNHLTAGDAVLTGDALSLFPFSVGQSDYGAKVEVARS
jgi:anaerobic selenocysteine-containing dehydrogenase